MLSWHWWCRIWFFVFYWVWQERNNLFFCGKALTKNRLPEKVKVGLLQWAFHGCLLCIFLMTGVFLLILLVFYQLLGLGCLLEVVLWFNFFLGSTFPLILFFIFYFISFIPWLHYDQKSFSICNFCFSSPLTLICNDHILYTPLYTYAYSYYHNPIFLAELDNACSFHALCATMFHC